MEPVLKIRTATDRSHKRAWYMRPQHAPEEPDPEAGEPVEHNLLLLQGLDGGLIRVPPHIDMRTYIDMRPAVACIRENQPRLPSEVYEAFLVPHLDEQLIRSSFVRLWDAHPAAPIATTGEEGRKDTAGEDWGDRIFEVEKIPVSQQDNRRCCIYVGQCVAGNKRWAAGFRGALGPYSMTCYPRAEGALFQFKSRRAAIYNALHMLSRWASHVARPEVEKSEALQVERNQIKQDCNRVKKHLQDEAFQGETLHGEPLQDGTLAPAAQTAAQATGAASSVDAAASPDPARKAA